MADRVLRRRDNLGRLAAAQDGAGEGGRGVHGRQRGGVHHGAAQQGGRGRGVGHGGGQFGQSSDSEESFPPRRPRSYTTI